MKRKQVFNNAKWIIICKIVQSLMQLVIGMISARYLGPSNYGLINYAASIVAFVLPIMKLGFDSTLVFELVESPDKEGEIMGTSLAFNTLSGLVGMAAVYGFVSVVNMGERETVLVLVLYSISIFFAALEMLQYWFQAKLLSKYSSIVMLISYVFVSAYKIFILASEKSVFWFALSHSVEYAIVALLLFIAYFKKGGTRLSVSFSRFLKMFSKSRYYILASLMIVVIQNTDHVMLKLMIGEAENGFYTAAITTSAVAQFVFIAIIDSFRPLILSSKKESLSEFENNVSGLYSIIIYLSIAQSIFFTLFSPFVISLLYGDAYAASIPILRILVWYTAFSYIGIVRNIWLLAEEKQKLLPYINLSGVVVNICLNVFFIRAWGAEGAATASFITQFFMNFVFGFILKPVRPNNILILRSLSPRFFALQIKQIAKDVLKKQEGQNND